MKAIFVNKNVIKQNVQFRYKRSKKEVRRKQKRKTWLYTRAYNTHTQLAKKYIKRKYSFACKK